MMRYGRLPGIDKPVSRLVQGTYSITSNRVHDGQALLDEVFAQGCTTFDTAHVYAAGDCERAFGRWVHSRGVRDDVVLIDKGGHHSDDRRRVTPFDITADLHDSLARLGFEHIDLYLLHRDDPNVPVGPIVETLNEHQRAGLIGAFGTSNWSWQRVQEANRYAQQHCLQPMVASSPAFSLAEQLEQPWPDSVSISGPGGEEARRYYARTGTPLFTWSSLAGGFFSGRFTRDNTDSFTDKLDQLCVRAYCDEANFARLERAQALADQLGRTTAKVALAYVLNQPMNVFALVGCRTGAEFQANLEAMAIHLTEQQLGWLESGP